MKKIHLFILLSLFLTCKVTAQAIDEQAQSCVNDFFEGYNTQNFEKMRDRLSPIMKLVFNKKNTEVIYGTQYEIMGSAKIQK